MLISSCVRLYFLCMISLAGSSFAKPSIGFWRSHTAMLLPCSFHGNQITINRFTIFLIDLLNGIHPLLLSLPILFLFLSRFYRLMSKYSISLHYFQFFYSYSKYIFSRLQGCKKETAHQQQPLSFNYTFPPLPAGYGSFSFHYLCVLGNNDRFQVFESTNIDLFQIFI